MGHYYRLHCVADVGGGIAQQEPLPSGRNRYGGLRHRADRAHFRNYADCLQRGADRLDHLLSLVISAGTHAPGLCLCAGGLHREPDWIPGGL